ncbi:MAG: MaoC family dehydratase [Burkholderiaceae bacterium]|nr:MaoC family dehydratase [Burkholderiaceae bacterium]
MKYERLNKYVITAKQKGFNRDFFANAEQYETWDEVKIGMEYEAAQKFEVTAEDIKAFSQAVMDSNPLFNDEEYAKGTRWGGLIGHPIFYIAIGFYCTGLGPSSWIRTPGAYNPGQRNMFYDPFRVGDIITLKLKSIDKWIKRGKYYLQYRQDYIDQRGKLKMTRYPTLIVPPTRAEMEKFVAIGRA